MPLKRRNEKRLNPYRTGSVEKDRCCSICFVEISDEESKPFNELYWPCPYKAPRTEGLCYECLEVWLKDNDEYCEPYRKIKAKVPVQVKEFTKAGIMTSMPFEMFYPNLKPGESIYK